MSELPFIARGSCDACPALQGERCWLGRAQRKVRVYSELTKEGFRVTVAPAGKCKRPRNYTEFMAALRK